MNAAARLVHQSVFSRHLITTYILTRKQMTIFILALMILFSALSVIYVTHTNRVLNAGIERALLDEDRLHTERGQLLLERGALITQARVQTIAEEKLGMVLPDHKSVVIIHE